MRYLVLSDIHSNIEALEACLALAKRVGYDSVLCCGDIVGYGPNPLEAIDAIQQLDCLTIRGNHDRVAAGLDDAAQFNPHARRAAYWTRDLLPESYRDYLRTLPVGPLAVDDSAQLVHGAVTHEDNYIFTVEDAEENFRATTREITFFGHSHFPIVFSCDRVGNLSVPEGHLCNDGIAVELTAESRYLVNPGSVGQPRDGDARASFGVWDKGQSRMEFYRMEYAVEVTQRKMKSVQLPAYLIDRLSEGR